MPAILLTQRGNRLFIATAPGWSRCNGPGLVGLRHLQRKPLRSREQGGQLLLVALESSFHLRKIFPTIIDPADARLRRNMAENPLRRRVFYHRNLVAKLSGKANSRLDARMRYEPDDDELMNTMLLELRIQICVGEATRTPMLCGDYLA